MKSRTKKIILTVLTVILAAALIWLIIGAVQRMRAKNAYSDLQKSAKATSRQDQDTGTALEEKVTTSSSAGSKNLVTSSSEGQAEAAHSYDFDKLHEVNPDIYAWLTVPGTAISYPVVRSGDDKETDYYLTHTVDGVSGLPASIYSEKENAADFSDFNTVIYGHNMKDGTMFRDLHKFEDQTFFDEHTIFTIETEDRLLTYTIFDAVEFDDRHLLKAYDYTTQDGRQAFLTDIENVRNLHSHLRNSVSVSTSSHIVTLSTCVGDNGSARYLVAGVLTNEQKLAG